MKWSFISIASLCLCLFLYFVLLLHKDRLERFPNWKLLWSNLVQEEFRQNTRDGSSSKIDDEENCALAGKAKKGKGKKSYSKSKSGKEGKKCDMSIVKYIHCHKHGHYATNCLQKKKKKNAWGSATADAFASQFELDFSLITCMFSSAMGPVWYLDGGAYFHMTREKEIFSSLEEKDL